MPGRLYRWKFENDREILEVAVNRRLRRMLDDAGPTGRRVWSHLPELRVSSGYLFSVNEDGADQWDGDLRGFRGERGRCEAT
jgi:hypothetical protein